MLLIILNNICKNNDNNIYCVNVAGFCQWKMEVWLIKDGISVSDKYNKIMLLCTKKYVIIFFARNGNLLNLVFVAYWV